MYGITWTSGTPVRLVQRIPCVFPGRTGTQLYPQDLANTSPAIPKRPLRKEATGDLKNMELTRQLCGEVLTSSQETMTKLFAMMTSPDINASGRNLSHIKHRSTRNS